VFLGFTLVSVVLLRNLELPPITVQDEKLFNTVASLSAILFAFLSAAYPNYIARLFEPPKRENQFTPKIITVAVICLFLAYISIIGGSYLSYVTVLLPITDIQFEGNNQDILVAYTDNSFLWRRPLNGKITKAILNDLDGDNYPEVIAGLADPGDDTGYLVIYSTTGQAVDKINTWQETIYPEGEESYYAKVVDFQVGDLEGDGKKDIIILSNDIYWFASRILVYEFRDGKLIMKSVYWHPGYLYKTYLLDLNKDNTQELLVTGVNNDLKTIVPELGGNIRTVMMFEGDRIGGQAPPGFGINSNGEEYPLGTQSWYFIIQPKEVADSKVIIEDIDKNGIDDIHLGLSDSCSFYININGEIIQEAMGTVCKGNSSLDAIIFSNE